MAADEKSENESSDEESDCDAAKDSANPGTSKARNGRVVPYLPPAGFRFYNLAMEIFVETLTGTVFELRVSPFETIMSVKAKIQRIEGIPIVQQHLIYQTAELEDDYCLHDYNVNDGATLKLVLAMRGGPINTRRIPMEDSSSFREMTEFMEATHDDLLEQLPGNGQVTLLVFREGDHINFFRVVDRGDGTLTPLSENVGPSSLYGLPYPENSETDDEIDAKIIENDNTKEKMRSLLAKMKTSKKPKSKKSKKPSPRPGSSAHRPSSKSSKAKRTPTPRESRQGVSALLPDATMDETGPNASTSIYSSHLRQSGATVRLPPVLPASSIAHDEAHTKSIAHSLWEQDYLPEIMKRVLREQEKDNFPLDGLPEKENPESAATRGVANKPSTVTIPPSQNGCASTSPSVSNGPSSVSLTSPSSCSSATSSVAPTTTAPIENSSLPLKTTNGRPRVTPASTAAFAPDASLGNPTSHATNLPSNPSSLESTYPPLFPRQSSSKLPLHATTSNIPVSNQAKAQITPRNRPTFSGKKERTIEELWGYWKKQQSVDGNEVDEGDGVTEDEKLDDSKKTSPRVARRIRSGTGLPGVGSESSFVPHPPSLPPPGASGNSLLNFRNYKPQNSFSNRSQDEQVFEDWRQSRHNGTSFPYVPHPPTGPSPRRSNNSASQGGDKGTSSATRKYYEHHDLYGQMAPRSPSASNSGGIRLSSRGATSSGRVGQCESGKKNGASISSGNENLRVKGPPSGQVKQPIPSYGRIPSNSSFTHNDFMASLLSETARLRLSSKGQRNVISPNGTRIHSSRHLSSRGGLVSPPRGTRLPPVGAKNNSANVKKQKMSKRCHVCNKKTGIATSYSCRCGSNFCAAHRYAEAHNCTYDYKMEGRKILEQNNPVVTAPKLPKI